VVGVGGLLLLGIWWISNRRDAVRKVELGEVTLEEASLDAPLPETTREGDENDGRRRDDHVDVDR